MSYGSSRTLAIPAAAGATLIGAVVYYGTRPAKSIEDQRRDRVQSKRDNALGGAGVGGNFTTGGFETGQPGSGTQAPHGDPERNVKTDAPLEKLPSGGVGGGVGGGGTNARAIEMKSKKQPGDYSASSAQDSVNGGRDSYAANSGISQSIGQDRSQDNSASSSSSSSPSSASSTQQPRGFSERFQGLFGQGGKSASDTSEQHAEKHNTLVASNHAHTPTKRMGGADTRPSAQGEGRA